MQLQSFLDRLDLLRNRRQHALFQSIELVETSPGTDLAQTDKDAAHRLEVERFVAVEDQHETAQLMAQGFDGLRFTGAGRSEWRTAQSCLERLGHRQIAAIGQRRLDQSVLNAQILEPVEEPCVRHVNGQLLQDIALTWVKVESHLAQPFERLGIGHVIGDQASSHCAFVNEFVDLEEK